MGSVHVYCYCDYATQFSWQTGVTVPDYAFIQTDLMIFLSVSVSPEELETRQHRHAPRHHSHREVPYTSL